MVDVSLVIPTYGRYIEVERLLQSLAAQDYPLDKIEIIIIDQNDSIDITPVIQPFENLNIRHIKTLKKGIANAKNLGISYSRADIISFPDDDCTYYSNTVSSVINFFENNPTVNIAYGRIWDRDSQINIMRNWPDVDKHLNLFNFHLNYSAITCFSKRKDLVFDERFGVGAYYSSGEELDYIIVALEKKINITYTPSIEIWHPPLNVEIMPLKKVYEYAKGYGAICKKHKSFAIFYLFFKSTFFHVLLLFRYIIGFNKKRIIKQLKAIKGRLDGFYGFKRTAE